MALLRMCILSAMHSTKIDATLYEIGLAAQASQGLDAAGLLWSRNIDLSTDDADLSNIRIGNSIA